MSNSTQFKLANRDENTCTILIQKTHLESFRDNVSTSFGGPKSAIDSNSSICKHMDTIHIKGTVLNLLCPHLHKKQTNIKQEIFYFLHIWNI